MGLAAAGTFTGTASASSGANGSKAAQADCGSLQKPVRAEQPSESARALLDALAEQNVPHINTLDTEAARELFNNFFIEPEPQEVGRVENMEVSGPNGPVPIRVYWPSESRFEDGNLPVSVYMHGGGWVLGNLETHDSVARSLTEASEGILVAIDYRRGPEHPFPAAVEDCWAVCKWVATEGGEEIGACREQMAVTGESAGGDMTAVMTFLAKENEDVNFVYQLPIYPVTDLTGSWIGELEDTFSILNPETEQQLDRRYLVTADLSWFATRYLPYEYAANNLYTSPLLARSDLLEGLPPATIVTTGFGPLGDQGYLYAKHLQEAGVPVETTHYPEMIHDFFNMEFLPEPFPDIPEAEDAKRRAGETLRGAFVAVEEGRDPATAMCRSEDGSTTNE